MHSSSPFDWYVVGSYGCYGGQIYCYKFFELSLYGLNVLKLWSKVVIACITKTVLNLPVSGDQERDGEMPTRAETARPRLCKLKLCSNFNGFGFVLTAESERPGLYIENVEDSSPAKAGGLQSGDRIVEVN